MKLAVAIGIFAAGIGGAYAIEGVRKIFKRKQTHAEQDEWRQMGEEMRAEQEQKGDNIDDEALGKTG